MNTITLDARKRFVIHAGYETAPVLRRIPDKNGWDAKTRRWLATPSRVTVEYLRKELPDFSWSDDAVRLADELVAAATPPPVQSIDDYPFCDPQPWEHQRREFARSRGAPAWALLMEQRTGKTRIFCDTASDLWLRGRVDLAMVVCPNSVKSVWADQVPQWAPTCVQNDVIVYSAAKKKEVAARLKSPPIGKLQWLIVNVEAFSTDAGQQWIREHVRGRRIICGVDEASRIKSPSASRTKYIVDMARKGMFAYRRIMTGTLITQGPLDAYAPFKFLDPAILGYSTFSAFRNDFALMGGYNGREVIGYVNVDKLSAMIKPFSSRVLREQCFDIPPKVYGKVAVELSPEQRRIYDEMRDQMFAELTNLPPRENRWTDADGVEHVDMVPQHVSATIILTQMLRLQQIVGGFFPDPTAENPADAPMLPIPGPNPKLEALVDELEEETGKVVIWARFRAEIAMIAARLRKIYGHDAVVEFHGGVSPDERARARRLFEWNSTDTATRFFIGQAQTGGVGIDLARACTTIYFSNSFSLEDRLQTEDRTQNGNKRESTGYVDLVAVDTIDDKRIIPALRGKKNIADQVNGDEWKAWI